MIVTVHQPEHLPGLGFFDKMRQADVFVLLDSTEFSTGDFQNRNRIKTRNGPAWLTVPIVETGASQPSIIDMSIRDDPDWRNRCWNLIYESYRRAPYFAQYSRFFEELYAEDWSRLLDLNTAIIRYLAEQLGLKTKLVTAWELGGCRQGPTSVLLTICRLLGANVYLSGKYGRVYLDEAQFAAHEIEVIYQDFQHPVYPQLWGAFLSDLSAIDLLFNCAGASLGVISRANSQTMGTTEESAGVPNTLAPHS